MHQGVLATAVTNGAARDITAAGTGCLLYGYIHLCGSTASEATFAEQGTATIEWDDTQSGGTVAGDKRNAVIFDTPLVFSNGLQVDFTGAGTNAALYVLYIPL